MLSTLLLTIVASVQEDYEPIGKRGEDGKLSFQITHRGFYQPKLGTGLKLDNIPDN